SVVAYGPEITSLLFIMTIGLLFLNGTQTSWKSLILAGVLIGLVDSIWYPNFYLLCMIAFIIPVIAIARRRDPQHLYLGFLSLALVAKIFYLYMLIFFSLWILLLASIVVIYKFKPNLIPLKALPFYLALLISTVFWRFPNQIRALISNNMKPGLGGNPIIYFVDIPGLVDTGIRFLAFLSFYLTPGFIIILLIGLVKGRSRYEALRFSCFGLVAALGTIFVFSRISGSLQPLYIFSDSRFFLFVTTMMIIASGAFFSSDNNLPTNIFDDISRGNGWIKRNWKSIGVLGILGVSMVPGFLVMNWGLASVDIEERYGWSGLPTLTDAIGNSDSKFLADRSREFSWFTGKPSIALRLSGSSLGDISASTQVLSLFREYNASYLLIDDYTVASWGVFEYLLRDSISIGHSTILDHSAAIAYHLNNFTDSIYSCNLIGQTQPNSNGVISRIFQLSNESYGRFENIQLSDVGWDASNGGLISNSSGEIRLTIGSGATYTNTWRPTGSDLNLEVNGGYLLFDFEDAGAIITQIELLDSNGAFIAYAEKSNDGLYYCPFGVIEIGDIRIVIEGNPGDSVIINSISAWQVV
ncbi:MAG: hypothetical protein ACTSWQ_02235, partial [Candidatus Thorarchaeota archaeon]